MKEQISPMAVIIGTVIAFTASVILMYITTLKTQKK